MHVVFVDDSRQQNPRRRGLGELVALGAVIVPDDRIAEYTHRVALLRSRLGIPEEEEFKWNPAKSSFLAKASGDQVTDLTRGMLEAAAACKVVTVVALWDRTRVDWNKNEIEQQIRRPLFERFEYHLKEMHQPGLVICDEPGGGRSELNDFMADSRTLLAHGTDYVRAKRVVLPFMTAPSDHVAPLQLADLVTAATTAAVAGYSRGLALLDLLNPLMRRDGASGRAGGYGLLLWPPELCGLYYWMAGDTEHHGRSLVPPGGHFAWAGNDFTRCGLHNASSCDCALLHA